MDRNDWLVRIQEEEWAPWAQYMESLDRVAGGSRTVWGLNFLSDFCESMDHPGHPEHISPDPSRIRAQIDQLFQEKSVQQQNIALSLIRRMLGLRQDTHHLLEAFPRHRRIEGVNRIHRQCRVVLEDALPRNVADLWVKDVLKEILEHSASGNWRTSKTANQTLHLIHRFLRCAGLLDFGSKEAFESHIRELQPDRIQRLCLDFTDKFCATSASARRYTVIFNHLFHRVWNRVPAPITMPSKKRRIRTLEELEDHLSSQSSSSSRHRQENRTLDFFGAAELQKLRTAAAEGPAAICRKMIILLLEMTGLRRMGVLNLLVSEVAERVEGTGRFVAKEYGRTLTKGGKWHRFPLPVALRSAIEDWLNTPECKGGKPHGPSSFLLPSGRVDNGQMSTTTLTRIFKDVCNRAGFGGDPRAHLHAMRHSCAHTLQKNGNSTKQISLLLGHKSVAVTEAVYLRDSVENTCAGMVLPSHWGATEGNAGVEKEKDSGEAVTAGVPMSKKKNKSTRQSTMEVLEMMKAMMEHT